MSTDYLPPPVAETGTPVHFGGHDWPFRGPQLAELEACNADLGDPAALRQRLETDGYLLVRGMHPRQTVLEAGDVILGELDERGWIDRSAPLREARVSPTGKGGFLGGDKKVTHTPEFLEVVESRHLMAFFAELFGGPVLTYDFKWLRTVNAGFTGFHYDVVYMGRGTRNVCTCWTPYCDITLDRGPLALCLGSQHFEKIKQTYGEMDVDRDKVHGWFSNDPQEILDKFGGQWATTTFAAGDVLIFGMYMMHGSINNVSGKFRISSDTRYQLAADPVDDRWVGENPKAHYAWHTGEKVSMEDARKRWGI